MPSSVAQIPTCRSHRRSSSRPNWWDSILAAQQVLQRSADPASSQRIAGIYQLFDAATREFLLRLDPNRVTNSMKNSMRTRRLRGQLRVVAKHFEECMRDPSLTANHKVWSPTTFRWPLAASILVSLPRHVDPNGYRTPATVNLVEPPVQLSAPAVVKEAPFDSSAPATQAGPGSSADLEQLLAAM